MGQGCAAPGAMRHLPAADRPPARGFPPDPLLVRPPSRHPSRAPGLRRCRGPRRHRRQRASCRRPPRSDPRRRSRIGRPRGPARRSRCRRPREPRPEPQRLRLTSCPCAAPDAWVRWTPLGLILCAGQSPAMIRGRCCRWMRRGVRPTPAPLHPVGPPGRPRALTGCGCGSRCSPARAADRARPSGANIGPSRAIAQSHPVPRAGSLLCAPVLGAGCRPFSLIEGGRWDRAPRGHWRCCPGRGMRPRLGYAIRTIHFHIIEASRAPG